MGILFWFITGLRTFSHERASINIYICGQQQLISMASVDYCYKERSFNCTEGKKFVVVPFSRRAFSHWRQFFCGCAYNNEYSYVVALPGLNYRSVAFMPISLNVIEIMSDVI